MAGHQFSHLAHLITLQDLPGGCMSMQEEGWLLEQVSRQYLRNQISQLWNLGIESRAKGLDAEAATSDIKNRG
eukprot:1145776-Pelagomonas_calceolata.AAC.1